MTHVIDGPHGTGQPVGDEFPTAQLPLPAQQGTTAPLTLHSRPVTQPLPGRCLRTWRSFHYVSGWQPPCPGERGLHGRRTLR